MGIITVLIGFLIIVVTFLIRAEFAGEKTKIFILKPLSTLIIIGVISLSFFVNDLSILYKSAILLGMLFCLGGDIALMFDSQRAFLIGLVLFLLGHIVYTIALISFNGFLFMGWESTTIITVLSSLIFFYLYSGLEKMKIPVLFYVVIISLMLNSGILTHQANFFSSTQAWHLAIGASLFYISDVILAVNKFKFPFAFNRFSLVFYFSGQLFIALSTHPGIRLF